MKQIKTVGLALVLLSFSPAVLFCGERFTLDRCIEYGLANSPVLKSAEFMVEGADNEIKSARADFLPSVSSTLSGTSLSSLNSSGPTESDYLDQDILDFQVSISQVLYAGSRIYATYSRAAAKKEMAEADEAFARLKLVYGIETAFFELLKAKQDVKSAKDTVDRLQAGVDSANAYFEKELVPYVQVLQTGADLADARLQMSRIVNTVENRRAELFALMNMDFSSQVTFAGELNYYPPRYKFSLEECWESARKNRPDLKSLEKQMVMANKAADMALGKYLPTLKFNVYYADNSKNYNKPGTYTTGGTYDRDQQNRYWAADVSATWQLFDGGKAWFERKTHLADINRIRQDIKSSENEIHTGIKTILFDLSQANTRVEQSLVALSAANEYYKREKKRFQAGISTIPSLLDAQVRLTRAERNYNQALLEFQVARSALNFMTGKVKG